MLGSLSSKYSGAPKAGSPGGDEDAAWNRNSRGRMTVLAFRVTAMWSASFPEAERLWIGEANACVGYNEGLKMASALWRKSTLRIQNMYLSSSSTKMSLRLFPRERTCFGSP
jgi:hypothetical protein